MKLAILVCLKSSWRSPSTERLFAQNSGPDRSEMEVRAFASIRKVTWDKLLASKAEIITLYVMDSTKE